MPKRIEIFYDVDNKMLTIKTTGLGLSKIQLKSIESILKREIDYYIEEIKMSEKIASDYCSKCGSKIKK